MRRPVFFATWKSNKTPKEVLEFFEQVYKRGLELENKTEVILAPAACYYEIARLKMPKPLQLGYLQIADSTTPSHHCSRIPNITLYALSVILPQPDGKFWPELMIL